MIEIQIPRLGWSMEEGTFLGWLKKDGDKVTAGEPLFTLENEKAAQDVESTDSGILKISKEGPAAGQVVQVGQVIGHLANAEFAQPTGVTTSPSPSTASPVAADGKPAAGETGTLAPIIVLPTVENQTPAPSLTRPRITPRARRRAAELGVDASKVEGTGQNGRVTEKDVLKNAPAPSAVTTGLSNRRRVIAQRTSASFSSVPHFYLKCELDATALLRLREDLIPEIEARAGVRLTVTDLIVRAQGLALRDVPAANAIWANDNVVALPSIDVGLVVGLKDGLLIPIIRSPEAGDLASVAKQRGTLVESARAGKLTTEAQQGGSTSLSNLGSTRVDEFSAVISPPQSTMLAVGRAAPRPYLVNGKYAVRTTLRLCLSVDHRVLDGAPAAEFLGRITEYLEDPARLV